MLDDRAAHPQNGPHEGSIMLAKDEESGVQIDSHSSDRKSKC